MAKVKSFGCQLQISKSTTLLEMSVKIYAILSLYFCAVLVLYLFPGPFPGQKKSSNIYSEAIKDAQSWVVKNSCHGQTLINECSTQFYRIKGGKKIPFPTIYSLLG